MKNLSLLSFALVAALAVAPASVYAMENDETPADITQTPDEQQAPAAEGYKTRLKNFGSAKWEATKAKYNGLTDRQKTAVKASGIAALVLLVGAGLYKLDQKFFGLGAKVQKYLIERQIASDAKYAEKLAAEEKAAVKQA